MEDIINMKSPGVFINIVDLSQYTALLSRSKRIAVIGFGRSGEANKLVQVERRSDFLRLHGNPLPTDYSALMATHFLNESSNIWYYRIANESSLVARDATITGAGQPVLTVSFKTKGTLYDNEVYIQVSNNETDMANFDIRVFRDDNRTLYSGVNIPFEEIKYIQSEELLFTVNEMVGILTLDPQIVTFSIGDDGIDITNQMFDDACQDLSDPETSDIDIVACPLICSFNMVGDQPDDSNMPASYENGVDALINLGLVRKDCTIFIDPPQGISDQQTVDLFNGMPITIGSINNIEITKPDTSHVGVMSPWVKVPDGFLNENRWTPPSVAFIPALGLMYQTYQPWSAPAGQPRMNLKLVIDVERVLRKASRDLLYVNHINPVCNYKQRGMTVLGQKTMQRATTSLDRLNVEFLVNYVRKVVEYSTVGYLFSPIDEETFTSWIQVISKELETIRVNRGIYDYRVKMDWETVTPELLNNNIMYGIIQIKPTKSAEFIPIDVVLRNRDDSFDGAINPV
jgi:Lysine/ornithine N-monooxygenase